MVIKFFTKLFIPALGVFYFLLAPALPALADLDFQWKVDNVNVNDYLGVNLYRMDLKDMLVEIESNDYDVEDGLDDEEGIDEGTLQDIANEFFARFSQRLEGIVPILRDKEIDPADKSLITELTLSGKFEGIEPGLLMSFIAPDSPRRKTTLTFKCNVKDSRNEQVLLEMTDQKEFTYYASERPLTQDDDFASLSELIDFWAKSFAGILEEKKI